jgi:hypothetical protein
MMTNKRSISRIMGLIILILLIFLLLKIKNNYGVPPVGYPITILTQSGEKVYFEHIYLEFIDMLNLEKGKNKVFRFETDAGQLIVRDTLIGVEEFEVLELPDFSQQSQQTVQEDLSSNGAVVKNIQQKKRGKSDNTVQKEQTPKYSPLRCKLRLKFRTGKVLEGYVTVYPKRNENRVWGQTPEGVRHMALSDVVSIKLGEN